MAQGVWQESGGGGGGSGTVTSVDASGGVQTTSGSAITDTGTIRSAHVVNAQTGATYALASGDRGKLVTINRATAVAVSIAQAGTTGFETGYAVFVDCIGAGTATVTPTTSTINGAATLVLTTEMSALIVSDGTNYRALMLSELTAAELAAVKLAVANGLATYDTNEIDNRAGVPNISAMHADMEANNYPRAFTIYQEGAVSGPVTQAAATWTSVSASNNGSGKLRLSSAGVHGLSTTGQSIYVTFATTGTGLHEIATVVNTTTLDFTTDYSAISGAVTVYLVGAVSPWIPSLAVVPGNYMGPNGSVDIQMLAQNTGIASSRYVYLDFGSASGLCVGLFSAAGDVIQPMRGLICNQNDVAAQIGSNLKPGTFTLPAGMTVAATQDTTTDKTIGLRFKIGEADSYYSLANVHIRVTPGL